ncbi:isatin hydrolase-like [Crassostrea angulata]|uniref:isatin hydrolase-like n=1 Tax=Magallana angulata TaxID=2784310 RepID=UPI0022B1DC91|nr:isatin hydrolase-like [Crassostrea angulata]
MSKNCISNVLFWKVALVSLVQAVPRIVDLSHILNNASLTWPGNPPYEFTVIVRGFYENSWIENNHFAMPEHMGTHIDAPVHTVQGMWKTDQIPMENLYGAGVIINVKSKAVTNPDYRVTVEDLLMWEEKYGEMPRRAVAIMNSGWSSKYPNKTLVFGSPEPTDISTLHFPSWHVDACTWLINKRQINAVGVDTPSTDYGMTSTFPCHTILGKNRVVGIENVANLDNVPESGSTIYIPVLNIADGSGGPARVFATYDDEPNKTNAAALVTCFTFFLYFLAAVLACNVL